MTDPKSAEKFKLNLKFTEILPNNSRVKQKIVDKKEKEKELIRLKEQEEEQKRDLELYNEAIQRKEEDAKRKNDEEEKNIEKEEKKARIYIEKGEGNMNEILRSIWRNTSTYEINFCGLDLVDWDFFSLMTVMKDNMSVLTLNLTRKGLNDEKAKKICDMLKHNKKLKRLELEGNLFTSESCQYFGEALKENKHLRYLDLENNFLTDNGKTSDGIILLCNGLLENTMLISLNLSNNGLNDICAQKFNALLLKNTTLIHLELFDNQTFQPREKQGTLSKYECVGSSVQHTNTIKTSLNNNREKDAKWRLKEWKERKEIKSEDLEVQNNAIYLSNKKNELQMKVEERNSILEFYKDKFENELKDMEEAFQKNVEAHYIETRMRLDKKPKKSAPKKK